MSKVEIENITVKYGNHTVLKDFSLNVEKGQILGIVGPSGCGKTTIVRSICGFINPDEGIIRIDGEMVYSKKNRINVPPENRNNGIVFQDYAVWPHLSVFDNVAYPLKKRKIPKEQIAEEVAKALDMVNMSTYGKYMPAQLSGGQQQRVAIARALTSSSEFLIMDEPITNLDAKLREQMLVEIRMLQEKLDTTIIYITHDQEAAMQLCDEIVILNPDGSIAQRGNDEEIISKPRNRFVFQFIGITNFIPVIHKDARLVLDNGGNVVIHDTVPENYPSTPKADLGLRPMDIVFDEASPLKAKISQAVFLGNIYNYFVSFESMELRVQKISTGEPGEKIYKEGETVGLRFLKEFYFEREADK